MNTVLCTLASRRHMYCWLRHLIQVAIYGTMTLSSSAQVTLTVPADIAIECNEATSPSNTGYATALTACIPPDITITHSDVPVGSCPTIITRTWLAVDECSNSSSGTQTIVIEDTTAPEISCPADGVVQCIGDLSGLPSATALDNCDPAPHVTLVFEFQLGNTIQRIWTAVDACGNGASANICVQNIEIYDSTTPEISCPDDMTLDPDDPIDPSFTGEASAEDNCSETVLITYDDEIIPDCGGAIRIRTWYATDDFANVITCVQFIIIPGVDPDQDGIAGECDNCPNVANPDLADADNDNIGDACDCNDGIQGGYEEGVDCGGNCTPCPPPVAVCASIQIYVDPGSPDKNGPGNKDIWLIPVDDFDAGSVSVSANLVLEVKRYLSNLTFDWTTGGACVDLTSNSTITNPDKGIVYRDCYPATTTDFNKIKLYKLHASDEFGSDECTGTVKVIPASPGLFAPVIHFIIPQTTEYMTTDRNDMFYDPERAYAVTATEFIAIPNPGQNTLQLKWEAADTDEDALIRIFDMSGQVIVSQRIAVTTGQNTLFFDMTNHPQGVYAIQMQTLTGVMSTKWVRN